MPAPAHTKLSDSIVRRPAQRALLEASEKIGEAVTSARLHEWVRRNHPDISRATFFRALKFLVEHGLFDKVATPSGNCVYQRATRSRKVFWICEDCSSVRSLNTEGIAEALREVAREQGFSSKEMTVQIRGHCGCVESA